MTIERMIRRGIFPILSERPLDESEATNAPQAKVYVIEVGAYSDRYIDAIFTTRELAEAFVADRKRRAFEERGRRAGQAVAGQRFTVTNGRISAGEITYRDVPAETFEEFMERHTWNEFGDVEEYGLWDMLPVVADEPTAAQAADQPTEPLSE